MVETTVSPSSSSLPTQQVNGTAVPETTTGPTTSSSSPRTARSRRGWLVAAIAVVIVIIAVVSGAVLIRPGSTPSKAATQVDFVTARQRANSTLAGYGMGPWTLVSVIGINDPSSISVANTYLTVQPQIPGLDCNRTVVGLGANITVPSSSWTNGNGSATLWELTFRNVTAGVIVDVLQGVATVAVSLTGAGCAASLAAMPPVSVTASSSHAAAQALEPYDAAFFARFPNATGSFGEWSSSIFGYPYPIWVVDYDVCPSVHAQFVAELNISTDYVLNAGTEVGACGPLDAEPLQLVQSLNFGDGSWLVSNGTQGAVYDWNVTGVNNNVTWANLLPLATESLAVSSPPPVNATEASIPVTSGWNLTARTPSNSTIATFDPTDWSWSGDTSERIQQNDSIQVVVTGPAVDDPSFVIWLGGAGDFYGNFQILI